METYLVVGIQDGKEHFVIVEILLHFKERTVMAYNLYLYRAALSAAC